MNPFENIAKKAFYLGVGLANFAAEQASEKLQELKVQGQKLADEMVARGEMTTEEARKFVDDLVKQAQTPTVEASSKNEENKQPRPIEIIDEEDEVYQNQDEKKVDQLRQQVESLQEELRRLQNN
jgi:polyhydroxyalkanoate synthesis regulator phasin